MSKKRWFLVLAASLAVGFAVEAAAATSWKKLGENPFYRPPLSSEADLRTLVKTRSADLKTGFAKAGYPELYPAFMEQFPRAKIDSVTVGFGDTFSWVVFKKKATGLVSVLKAATWRGPVAFEAYRFAIDWDGKRHEFVVPYACGNVALRSVGPIPPPPVAAVAPTPAPAVAAAAPTPAPAVAAVSPAPALMATPKPAAVTPPPAAVAAPAPVASTPAPAPASKPVVPPPPAPVPQRRGGVLLDVGLLRQPDPANYLLARVGYELPLAGKLSLVGLVGGAARWMGNDGGSAFTADLMLDYHWPGRHSVGVGVGFWSGNDGQIDLIADLAYRLLGSPDRRNGSLFLEARLPADELGSVSEFGRFGLGLRFRL